MGFLLLILYPSRSSRSSSSSSARSSLSQTICHTQLCQPPSFTHNFVTHHLSHTIFHTHTHIFVSHHLSHTIFHTQLCHPPSFTHIFVTHHLSHTSLSHTIFHTQLCHPPSFTHIFATHHPSHTSLSHTIFHTHLCHLPSFTHIFVVWHGRRGACCTWWRAWSPLVARGAAPLCVAGVALVALGGAFGRRWSPGAPRHFAWQAWHLVTSTFVSRGRRGTCRHPPSFCVAGVALGDIHLHFTWQAWHLETYTFVLRGKRGTCCTWWRVWSPLVARGAAPLCVAGVALIAPSGAFGRRWSPGAQRHFAWHRFAWQAWRLETYTCVWRGKRGTCCTWWRAWTLLVARGTAPLCVASFCVAGVALGDIHLRFTWQAWHLVTSTFVSRGKRGTYGTGLALAGRLDPPSLSHHLSHTTLSHTICDTPLCHTPSVTHHL